MSAIYSFSRQRRAATAAEAMHAALLKCGMWSLAKGSERRSAAASFAKGGGSRWKVVM